MSAHGATIHACAVEIDGVGVLIEGPSGSGKTSLALGLLEAAERRAIEAHFVCDDRALVEAADGVLVARVPAAIAGKVEIRGFGIAAIAHRPSCRIGLAVRLVGDEMLERMPPPRTVRFAGVELPRVEVPARHEAQGVRIVMAVLARMAGGAARLGWGSER